MDRILTVAALAIVVVMLLAACAPAPQTVRAVDAVRINVPVAVNRQAPSELLAPITSKAPTFVAPSDPKATSALTADGERDLRNMLIDLRARLSAWKEWAEAE